MIKKVKKMYSVSFKVKTKDGFKIKVVRDGFSDVLSANNYKVTMKEKYKGMLMFNINVKISDLINEYLIFKNTKCEYSTIRNIKSILNKLNQIIKYVEDIDIKSINDIFLSIVRLDIKNQSKNNIIGIYKDFFGWLYLNNRIEHSIYTLINKIFNSVKVNPENIVIKDIVNKEEFMVLIDDLNKDSFIRVSLILMFYGGLRVSEVMAIKLEDIDFSKQVIRINKIVEVNKIKYHTKNNTHRFVYLTKCALEFVREYIESNDINEYLFYGVSKCSKYGFVFNSKINKYLKIKGKLLNKNNLTCHSLRHSFATIVCENYNDIKLVAKQLGHSSINTTRQVYERITENRENKFKKELDKIFE